MSNGLSCFTTTRHSKVSRRQCAKKFCTGASPKYSILNGINSTTTQESDAAQPAIGQFPTGIPHRTQAFGQQTTNTTISQDSGKRYEPVRFSLPEAYQPQDRYRQKRCAAEIPILYNKVKAGRSNLPCHITFRAPISRKDSPPPPRRRIRRNGSRSALFPVET